MCSLACFHYKHKGAKILLKNTNTLGLVLLENIVIFSFDIFYNLLGLVCGYQLNYNMRRTLFENVYESVKKIYSFSDKRRRHCLDLQIIGYVGSARKRILLNNYGGRTAFWILRLIIICIGSKNIYHFNYLEHV